MAESKVSEDMLLAVGPQAKVLPNSCMPFVNRHDEVFQLLRHNINNIWGISHITSETIEDFRGLKLPIAGQMFGSGKTTLGTTFVKRLAEKEEAMEAIMQRLDTVSAGNLEYKKFFKVEWEKLKSAESLRVVMSGPNLAELATALGLDREHTDPDQLAGAILKMCKGKEGKKAGQPKSLFIHVDEVAALPSESIQSLRQAVALTFSKMHRICRAKGVDEMPRVFFYVSGRGMHFLDLDKGSDTSPLGTAWITLQMMATEYITVIREHLETYEGLELLVGRQKTAKQRVDEALREWTGGAPRLLLYVLRALHHGKIALKTGTQVIAALPQIYKILAGTPSIFGELTIDAGSKLAGGMPLLYAAAKYCALCKVEDVVHLDDGSFTTFGELARVLPFYFSPAPGKPGTFVVEHVGIVEFHLRVTNSHPVVGLLSPLVGQAKDVVSAAALLEKLAVQRLVMEIFFSEPGIEWKQVSSWFTGTVAEEKEVELDNNCPVQMMPKVGASGKRFADMKDRKEALTLHTEDLAAWLGAVDSGCIYQPRAPDSGSADQIWKQSWGYIELQEKSGEQLVSLSMAADEDRKSVKQGSVVLLIIAMAMHDSLKAAMGKEAAALLLADPGQYAVGMKGKNGKKGKKGEKKVGLLWKEAGAKNWTHVISQGEKVTCEGWQKDGHFKKELTLRVGHQIVIPSPSSVREFVGNDDFELLRALGDKNTVVPDATFHFVARHFGKFGIQKTKKRLSLSPVKLVGKRQKGSKEEEKGTPAFEFESWCHSLKLSKQTQAFLVSESLDTAEALAGSFDDLPSQEELKCNRGERGRFVTAVKKLARDQ